MQPSHFYLLHHPVLCDSLVCGTHAQPRLCSPRPPRLLPCLPLPLCLLRVLCLPPLPCPLRPLYLLHHLLCPLYLLICPFPLYLLCLPPLQHSLYPLRLLHLLCLLCLPRQPYLSCSLRLMC